MTDSIAAHAAQAATPTNFAELDALIRANYADMRPQFQAGAAFLLDNLIPVRGAAGHEFLTWRLPRRGGRLPWWVGTGRPHLRRDRHRGE